MNRVRRALAPTLRVAIAACLGVAVTATPAAAGPPLEGSGTGRITSLEVTSERTAGGNSIQDRRLEGRIDDGPLAGGTFVQDVTGTVHANGHVTFRGVLVFTGSIEGCGTGEVTLGVSGRGTAGAAPATDARVRVIRQPANTIAVTGQGTVTQDGALLTYDIEYKCR